MLLAAAAFALSTAVSPVAAIACLAVGLFFLLGTHPVFWAMPAAFLSGAAAAAGIALINSIGNLGGFVAPTAFGFLEQKTGSIQGGMYGLALTSLLAAVVIFFARTTPKGDPHRPKLEDAAPLQAAASLSSPSSVKP